jgi:hypothetical protein
MNDLTAFLNARVDELEAAANEIHRPRVCRSVDRDGDFDPDPIWCSCDYPARVLRDVEADRKLLAEFLTAADWDGNLEFAIRCRMERFSDHPDYNHAWKP